MTSKSERRGRPPKPLDPEASSAARLGAELRALRAERGLTLEALGRLVGFSPQHISEVERARTPPSHPFTAACDRALEADGRLLALLPAAAQEREQQRRERTAARRTVRDMASLRCEAYSDAGGEDLDPTNRRGLLGAGAGAGAAVALGLSATAVPTQARQIDPELPAHSARLLNVLGRHDAAFGPHDVLATVRHQVGMLAEHRQFARGELRTELMRVEARWAEFAAWLSEDTGDWRGRVTWTDRALRLAQESDSPDMAALAKKRQSQWAAQDHGARRAIPLVEAALRVPGTSAQTRAVCLRQAAQSYAMVGDTASCQRGLADTYGLVEHADSPAPPWAGEFRCTHGDVRAAEARCWLWMQPSKAIPLYEVVLCDWPRNEMRTGGVHQARLALACAAAGERERAKDEGRKALAITRATGSSVAARELKRLGGVLSTS